MLVRKIFLNLIFLVVFLFLPGLTLAVSLDEKTDFYVNSTYDLQSRKQISAILKKTGQNAYFYLDNDWWRKLSSSEQVQKIDALDNLAKEFDEKIYPTLRKTFGTEWRPGIDNDERITILAVPMPEKVGGYFNPLDEYLLHTRVRLSTGEEVEILNSNEREMIYFNASKLSGSLEKGLIAQEFQHLISFYQKEKLWGVSEETWLNELRSEVAVTLCGYDEKLQGSNLEMRIKNFLDKPYDSLTEWKNTPNDYGVANLFGQYLVDHYGIALLADSLKSSEIGIKSLNSALKKLGFGRDFSRIFTDWTIASYVNDCSLGSEFCYRAENLKNFKLTPLANFIPFVGKTSFTVVNTTKDWAGNWYRFSGGHDVLKIEFFGGPEEEFQIPYIVTDIDGRNSLSSFSLDSSGRGTIYISDFGTKNTSLVIIPSVQQKTFGFSDNEPIYQFSWTASTIKSSEISDDSESPDLIPDGSLIRAKEDYRVYVASGKYRRWIQSPEIFNMYGHLKWENIIEVSKERLLKYQESFLVREKNDYKVYKIEAAPLDSNEHLTGQVKKRWLNMTSRDFEARGYKWDEIFIINQKERDYFPPGIEIL